jgi:hypothetical protein
MLLALLAAAISLLNLLEEFITRKMEAKWSGDHGCSSSISYLERGESLL